MRKYSERQGLSTLSEINITPLLDLSFVLLIIFMIATPLLDKSVDLVAPTSDTAQTEVDPAKVKIISINRFEIITFEDQEINLAELEIMLKNKFAAGELAGIVVRPHKELPVQKFIDIMDALQRAGITKVSVATRPSGEE